MANRLLLIKILPHHLFLDAKYSTEKYVYICGETQAIHINSDRCKDCSKKVYKNAQ